ncbi:MAG TPA: hypothetical protein VLE74_03590, partial [Candidatus Saccharimonadales bacterium]|nr:hypothetical protein [Candidatus Saccharimonadales bacterium]
MANNNANDKKTMDVNKPGESTPDTSSRPVIVTHRPMVQDPMMVGKTEKKADEEPAAEPAKPVSRADKTIQPLAEPADDKPAENKEPVETEKPAEPETAEEKDEPDEPEQEDKPAEAEETATDELADKTDVSEK